MALNEIDALYNWYQRVKQKDLGETRLDWLKFLKDRRALSVELVPDKETVSSMNKEDLQRCDGKEWSTADTVILERLDVGRDAKDDGSADRSLVMHKDAREDSFLEKSDVVTQTAEQEKKTRIPFKESSSPSVLDTPQQEHKSPFSTFLDKNFVTPPPLISYGDTVNQDESVASSVYSPTVPMIDFFSPAKSSDGNTTNDVMASLGGNFNESSVVWTSALATPCSASATEGHQRTNSPSTLERLTLHPKRDLRHKVMARSLFSPSSPGDQTSSSDEGSPNLGIIKCHSPVPVFKIKDDCIYKENSHIGNCQKLRVEGTQTFEVVEGKEPFEKDTNVPTFSERIGNSPGFIGDVVHSLCDKKDLGRCKTSTPLAKPKALSVPSNPEMCKNGKTLSNHSREVDFDQNEISEVKAVEPLNLSDVAIENSEDIVVCPFDIICSPAKKKSKSDENGYADTGALHLALSCDLERTEKSNSKGCDVGNKQSSCATTEKIEKMHVDWQERSSVQMQVAKSHDELAETLLNLHEVRKKGNYDTVSADVGGGVTRKIEPHPQLPNDTQILDPNRTCTEEKIIKIQSANNDEDLVSSHVDSTSNVSKDKVDGSVTSDKPLLKNEEARVNIAATSVTVPLKQSDERRKMSLFRKRKRTSGAFLYPTKSMAGNEKLRISFSKALLDSALNPSDFNSPDAAARIAGNSRKPDHQTFGMRSNQAKLPSEIEAFTSVQQSFVSLTNPAKDQKLQENSSFAGSDRAPQRNIVGDISPTKEERRLGIMNSTSSCRDMNVMRKNTLKASSSSPLASETVTNVTVKEKRPVEEQNLGSENWSPNAVYKSVEINYGNGEFSHIEKMKRDETEACEDVGLQVVPVMAAFEEEPLVVQDPVKDTLLGNKSSVDSGDKKQNQASQYWNDSLNEADLAQLDLEVSRMSSPPKTSAEAKIQGFGGFSTGLGDKVQVSATALHQAQKIFEDINGDVDNKENCNRPVDVNVENKISFDSMRNSLQTLGKENVKTSDQVQTPKDIQQHSSSGTLESPNPVDFGFRKASGALVTVSTDALKKAKAFLEEENKGGDLAAKEESFSETHPISENAPDSTKSGFAGFKTARGAAVLINKKSLEKARQLWLEENGGSPVTRNADGDRDISDAKISKAENYSNAVEQNLGADKTSSPNPRVFQGFATAAGSKIKVSEESLKRAQTLWEENEVNEDNLGTTKYETLPVATASNSPVFRGFSRTLGFKRRVNEEALVKEELMYEETSSDDVDEVSGTDSLRCPELSREVTVQKSAKFQGFWTASGSKVKVSGESLKKAQKLWEENEGDHGGAVVTVDNTVLQEFSVKERSAFQGFSTASGTKIDVSEASLEKARSLWEENQDDNEMTTVDPKMQQDYLLERPTEKSRTFQGFSTAAGSKIKVSEASLRKVRTLMDKDLTGVMAPLQDDVEIAVNNVEEVEVHSESLLKCSPVLKSRLSKSCSDGMNGRDNVNSHLNEISASQLTPGDAELLENENNGSEVHPNNLCRTSVQGSNVAGDFKGAKVSQPGRFLDFSTAKGKKMKVNKSSLNYVKNLFMDEDITDIVPGNCMDFKDHSEVTVTEQKANDGVRSDHGNQKITIERVISDVSSVANEGKDSSCGISTDCIKAISTSSSTEVQRRSSDNMCGEPNDVTACEGIEREESRSGNSPQGLLIEEEEGTTALASFTERNRSGNEERKFTINQEFGDDIGDQSLSPILGSQSCHPKRKVTVVENTKKKRSKRALSMISEDVTASSGEEGCDTLAPLNVENTIEENCIPRVSEALHSSAENIDTGNSRILSKPKTQSRTHSQPAGRISESCTVPTRQTRSQPFCQYNGSWTTLNKTASEREGLPSDTLEINNTTEAFLRDDSWEMENAVGKKRKARELDEEDVDRHAVKILKQDMDDHRPVDLQCTSVSVDQAVLEARELVRMKQENIIRYKRKHSVQPIQGLLHKERSARKDERIALRSLGVPKIICKVSTQAQTVTGDNASLYRFDVQDERVESIDCGEGCIVVPGVDGCIGAAEVEVGFLSMPGVSPALVPTGWVSNHYRWVVWKLAAMERRLLRRKVLTLENLVSRLKYRYDREIDRAERPILRKIAEHDDIPQKTMVLCVVSIKDDHHTDVGNAVPNLPSRNSPTKPILTLTDGWYSIGAVVDKAMLQIISEGRISVGTKLVIHGAELTGPPSPCHPLEAPASLNLRLHTNMTRRARWWSRLGLVAQRSPLPTQLAGVLGDGGIMGRVTVVISRIYPPIYFERVGGNNTFRAEKAHLRLVREKQQYKEATLHQIVTEVEKEFEEDEVKAHRGSHQGRQSLSDEEIRGLTVAKDITQLMENTLDPASLEGLLSRTQIELARSWQQRQSDEKKRRMNAEVQRRLRKKQKFYEAVPLLKLRLLDRDGCGAMLTVWRPSEELRQALKEGMKFNIHYVVAAGYRRGCLQLTATRQTRWERVNDGVPFGFPQFQRCVTPLCLTMSDELDPAWKEVDVVGVVFRIGQMEQGSQMVHIVDHHINILVLKFWGGLKDCGVEELICIESVICVSNGSWRGYSYGRCGCVHVTELSAVSICPRSNHLVEAVTHIKTSIKDIKELLHKADMKLDGQFDERALLSSGGDDVNRKSNVRDDRRTDASEFPAAGDENQQGNNTDQSSTPKSNRLQERSREVRCKLKALGMYGTPSPLRALPSNSSTFGTHRPFRAPVKQTNQL